MLLQTFVIFLFNLKFTNGLKCYICIYWNAPQVPQSIVHVNHISCGKGNSPENRFIQECEGDQICAEAHAEFHEPMSPKSISSRSCIRPDSLLQNKCISLKTLKDLYSLQESSRIVKFDKDGAVKEGFECGCRQNLCNSSTSFHTIVWMPLMMLVFVRFVDEGIL